MIELKIELNTNLIKQDKKVSSKNSEDTQCSFLKVFDEAKKSFDVSKNAVEQADDKKAGFFDRIKEKFTKKESDDKKTFSDNNVNGDRDISDDTYEDVETTASEKNTAEQNVMNTFIATEVVSGIENNEELNTELEVEDGLTDQMEQPEFDVGLSLETEKLSDNKDVAIKYLKPELEEEISDNQDFELQDNIKNHVEPEIADNVDSDIEFLKNDIIDLNINKNMDIKSVKNAAVQITQAVSQKLSDINQTLSSKSGGETSVLSDLIDKMNVKLTSVVDSQLTENDNSNDSSSFDFNSSSFSNLESHLTKLALNKDSISFDKVMQQKNLQAENILNQIKENTQPLVKGTSQVNIVLRPESLGRLNINLVSNNGVLSAQITAQSQQTADLLNKSLENLRQTLIEQGVKVADVNVKVQETLNSENNFDNKDHSGDQANEFLGQNMNKNSQGTEKNPHITKHFSSTMQDEQEDETVLSESEDTQMNEHDGLIDYRV